MIFRIEIELGNSAMQTDGDVRDMLERLARKVHTLRLVDSEELILDDNGNVVGKWGYYS